VAFSFFNNAVKLVTLVTGFGGLAGYAFSDALESAFRDFANTNAFKGVHVFFGKVIEVLDELCLIALFRLNNLPPLTSRPLGNCLFKVFGRTSLLRVCA